MYQFILPDAGEGTYESEVTQWFVKVGEEIKEDEPLLEIQSDKALVELPSPVTGILRKIYAEEGEMGIVGKPIADIEVAGTGTEIPKEKEASQTKVVEENLSSTSQVQTQNVSYAETDLDKIRQIAIPRVRLYAREKGVNLLNVTGTGNHGKVTIEDVDKFLATGGVEESKVIESVEEVSQEEVTTSVEKQIVETTPDDIVEKIPALRKTIAKAMVNSLQVSPHVTVFDQVVVDELVEHRTRMKKIADAKGVKLTYTAYFVKALVAMLKRFPELNVSMDLEKGLLYKHQYITVGVATNTEKGLVVPMVRNADRLNLFEIAEKITELSTKANEGKITASEMGRGSMTLTNVGGAAVNGVWSTPIINQPEVAIMGVGRIDEVFMPNEEKQPVLKQVLKISFAFDHRVVDGVLAQQAINTFKEYIGNPDLLLAEG